MDIWKFFDITHRDHVICNPTSEAKLDELVALLRLPKRARVVDIASGKGELLFRITEAYIARCTGVDVSPQFVAQARARLSKRLSATGVELVEMDGAKFQPETPHSLSLVSCLGASWIYGGHGGTLDALATMVEPGGWIIVGEPFWIQEPTDEYLQVLEQKRESFGTHESNARAGIDRGLELVYTLVSSSDDWDRYEGLQWYAASNYAHDNPNDPDVPELTERIERQRMAYLKWGRETLGWAIYMFRSPMR